MKPNLWIMAEEHLIDLSCRAPASFDRSLLQALFAFALAIKRSSSSNAAVIIAPVDDMNLPISHC